MPYRFIRHSAVFLYFVGRGSVLFFELRDLFGEDAIHDFQLPLQVGAVADVLHTGLKSQTGVEIHQRERRVDVGDLLSGNFAQFAEPGGKINTFCINCA